MKQYLVNRFREYNTAKAALFLVVALAGVHLTPEQIEAILYAAAALNFILPNQLRP